MIVWEKTEGFSAQNTSLNLGKESEVSCEGGWAKQLMSEETIFHSGERDVLSQEKTKES
jgi:hypothetical protein